MRDLVIHIRHNEIERISDRSARQVLKTLSVAVRHSVGEDLRELIFDTLDLQYAQRRSLIDRLDAPLKLAPSYHLEELRRGSLILTAVVSVAIIGIFAREIANVLADREDRRRVFSQIKAHLEGPWATKVVERILGRLSKGLGARMEMEHHEVTEDENHVKAEITAVTPPDEKGREIPHSDNETGASVTRYLEEQIAEAGGSGRAP